MTLGQSLRRARTDAGLTLRQVERVTGISNGYLSQLESDAIRAPSPHHLLRLADAYHVSYAGLMEAAGYPAPRDAMVAATGTSGSADEVITQALGALEELTPEDRRKIQAYIADLRDARRARASGG